MKVYATAADMKQAHRTIRLILRDLPVTRAEYMTLVEAARVLADMTLVEQTEELRHG